jgi:hypothetical protein
MQIDRRQAPVPSHRDGGIGQRCREWADDVPIHHLLRLEHHDHLAASPPERGLQGIPGCERLHATDDFVGRRLHDSCASAHDHDLGMGRQVFCKRAQGCVRGAVVVDDDDDRRWRRCGLIEQGRHGVDRAVERVPVLDHIGWAGRSQPELGAGVDHAPAGRLDARLEFVGGAPFSRRARDGSFLGQLDDVLGC